MDQELICTNWHNNRTHLSIIGRAWSDVRPLRTHDNSSGGGFAECRFWADDGLLSVSMESCTSVPALSLEVSLRCSGLSVLLSFVDRNCSCFKSRSTSRVSSRSAWNLVSLD